MLTLPRLKLVVQQTAIAAACVVTLWANAVHAKHSLDPYVAVGADDASLNALCATSPDRVWAVGDRGAIWATADGGRKWIRQESGTSANLHGIAFKNSSEGLAVGGLPGALGRMSRSIVLRTVNGGETWSELPSEGIPRFTGMRAVGGRLIAWGDYCPQRKSGIFYSLDDGQTWQAIESSIVHVAALGADASGGVLAVDRVGNAFNSQLGPLRSFFTASPHQPIAFVEHVGSTWMAGGADGQLLRTVDAQSWSRIALPLSIAAQRVCQWRTIAQFEDHLWITGTPGSIVVHSSDRGVNWQILSTEQTLPLSAIVFADSQRGWAIGPLGLIIATRDGGHTWYSQRRTATRVGLLSVTSTEAQVPWPALVATSWDELIAAKSLTLFTENLEQSADYRVEDWKLNEALAPQLGLVEHQAWLQPKPTDTSQGDLSLLADRLTVELQCWRPDVILTDESGGLRLTFANRAAMTALTTALQQAATVSPQSIAHELMLPAWQPTKLATVTEARSSQYSEHPNRLMREPGLSIWDVLAPTGAIYDANAASLPMRTIQQKQSTLASNASLFGGIAPSQASRRQTNARSLGNYQLIMGRVHRMTSLDNLVTLPAETPIAEWQLKLDFVLRTLPPRELAPSLMRIASVCSAPPLWPRRQLALERLIHIQPDSDVASKARFQLLQMLGSDELQAWRQAAARDSSSNETVGSLRQDPSTSISRSSLTPFDAVSAITVSATAPIRDQVSPHIDSQVVSGATQDAGSQVSLANFAAPSNSPSAGSSNASLTEASHVEAFFKALDACYKADPSLAKLPQLELMREAMARSRSDVSRSAAASTVLLDSIARLTALAGWPQVAQQELILANNRPEQLRWIAFAVATATRPRLDGVLDEPMWSACPPMKLLPSGRTVTSDTTAPAMVRWSFDDRYLYIAIDSPRDSRPRTEPTPKLRKYDGDLQTLDHVQLMLDTDRDYASAVELGVSSTGETFDRCCEMVQFNPQYAVAVPTEPQSDRWVVEMAIRLSDLTTRHELTGHAWAVSAHRRSLHGGNQSWSSMLSEQPSLQSAGLLLFVQPPNK